MEVVRRARLDLSIVIPVHDEAESLPQLAREIQETIRMLGRQAETIVVDDGSTDGTDAVLRELVRTTPRLRVIRLAQNAGQSAALYAGLHAATGQYVATLDGDLQNDPRDLVLVWSYLAQADAVIGWRRARRDGWQKRLASRVANFVRRAVTGHAVHDSACSLRLMRRECIEAIPPFDGMHRFVPTLLHLAGYRVIEVPVSHRRRRYGRSKYGIRNRAARAFTDLLAIRWMMSRKLDPYVAIESDDPTFADGAWERERPA